MPSFMRTIALVLALVAAGCVAPTVDPPADPAPALDPQATLEAFVATGAAPVTADVAILTDCLQGHWLFPGRAEDFQPFVPPGFTLVAADDGTTSLAVTPSRCTTGVHAGVTSTGPQELWMELFVKPPAELDDEGAVHVLPIGGYVSDPALAAAYRAWGFKVVHDATLEGGLQENAPTTQSGVLTVRTDVEHYEWAVGARGSPSDWGDYRFVRWVIADDAPVARVHLYRGPATSIGTGGVQMVYQGDAAPPVATGIAHLVADESMAMIVEAIV